MTNLRTSRPPSDFPETLQMQDARSATVPVVVLGATIGGLAAAVAIRSRTGRAVCVLDVQGEEVKQGEKIESDTVCALSVRCMDALRAINSDLYRSVMSNTEVSNSFPAAACSMKMDGPMHISCSTLRQILAAHLTTGHGGSSFFWRSCSVQHVSVVGKQEKADGESGGLVSLSFENGVVIEAGLVVVATDSVSVSDLLDNHPLQAHRNSFSTDCGGQQGEWRLSCGSRRPSDLEVALLTEAERRVMSVVASATPSTITGGESPATDVSPLMEGKNETLCEETLSSRSAVSVSSFSNGSRKGSVLFLNCLKLREADASWTFMDGRIVLTAAAAHPWASSLADGLELDLEDAAQLGCSLFDWKFQLRESSDRFEAIRQRRLATVITSPRVARSWISDFPEIPCGTSTVTSHADYSSLDEEQTFLPTRDAYAELLPVGGIAYEVQEAKVY
ncbi:hypothetical protein, conserved [Eimeria necatrix]|uniref:Uncharacterized protein n=1 Tax=Eimeria necatrix TaxID=51315 RepID=U6N2T6_9EIME|nr:hypothetical protein, conserved [Eimeria necatrix]CDJ69609.1 hypothetical protein, conserved [Eimeria necatrix]